MKKKILKSAVYLIAGVLLLIAAWNFLMNSAGEKPAASRGSMNQTVKVKRNNISNSLQMSGVLLPFRMVDVKPTMSGEIVRLYKNLGDSVKKGEALAEIRPDQQIIVNYLQKQNKLWRTEKDFKKKKKFYEDQLNLFRQKLIPAEAFNDAETDYLIAQKELELTRLDLEIFRNENGFQFGEDEQVLEKNAVLTSPIDGILLKQHVEPGDFVKSALSQYSEGTPVCTVGDLSRFIISLPVTAYDISRIKTGQQVLISTENSAAADSGTIYQISPMADVGKSPPIFDTKISFIPQSDIYRAGMSANVEIPLGGRMDAMVIPIQAVIARGDHGIVFVKTERGPDRKIVTIGKSDNHQVEVISGLDNDDEVYLNPREIFRGMRGLR